VDTVSFSDLARAAYCPRQLYYARRSDDRSLPADATARIELAFRYRELRASPRLASEVPIDVSAETYRRRLESHESRPWWPAIAEPARTEVFLSGRDCHGVATKILAPTQLPDSDTAVPTIATPGAPPESGVWEPQSVRAVAVALALSWEREQSVDRCLVEYPAHGVIREVRLTVRRKATYRRTLRTVRSMDGPPPRVDDDRCTSCSYRDTCGVRTRSLSSLLGL